MSYLEQRISFIKDKIIESSDDMWRTNQVTLGSLIYYDYYAYNFNRDVIKIFERITNIDFHDSYNHYRRDLFNFNPSHDYINKLVSHALKVAKNIAFA